MSELVLIESLTPKVRLFLLIHTLPCIFNKKSQLRSLGELEKFIQINKHLPEIPSTVDVTKNGIDLAEMQALLLQKVEELS